VRLGVIADTHGVVHPGVKDAFSGVDHIIHAGDIGTSAVIRELERIAPVYAIIGNREEEDIPGLLPDPSRVEIGGISILIAHRFIPVQIEDYKDMVKGMIKVINPSFGELPRIVIFGHTHYAYESEIEGIYFFNPGYAGPDPYEPDPSVGLIEVDGNSITGKIITLEK
jgi:putative phosphoesterase